MTSWIIPAGCVLLILIVLAAAKRLGLLAPSGSASAERMPYRKKDWLLSQAERSFYGVLCGAVDEETVIFAKVRLLDLLWLPKGTANAQSWRNRVQSKHVDFLLCTRDTVTPLLVIELDDSSHESERRRERDMKVDQVLTAAGLAFLHVKAARSYRQQELRQQIQGLLKSVRNAERPASAGG